MRKLIIATVVAAGIAATPVAAQQSGLINVEITKNTVTLLDQADFLNDNEVTLLNDFLNDNQLVVQVPIGVAANVCNIKANVLAQGNGLGDDGNCDATNASRALAQVVRRQMPPAPAAE